MRFPSRAAPSGGALEAREAWAGGAECVALKDERLVYRACSSSYARAIGQDVPDDIIGRTDFDLFPRHVAREQMALDSRALYTGRPCIGALELGIRAPAPQAMIVRSPVCAAGGEVRGIDLRLLGSPRIDALRATAPIDLPALFDEGIHGCVVFTESRLLFADAAAAAVLGFDDPSVLVDDARLCDLFHAADRARLASGLGRALVEHAGIRGPLITLTAKALDGRAVRLTGRVTPVRWERYQATLLSFVDVAKPRPANAPPTTFAGESGGDSALDTSALARLASENRKLRVTASRYRHYASAAADFFWEVDGDLVFRRVSGELERALGIPAEHLTGRRHEELAEHPSNLGDETPWRDHLATLADRAPFRDFEFRWVVGAETRVIRYSGVPVHDHEGGFAGYRGTGCDVTSATRQAEATAYHASHDALTGLANRRHFDAVVVEAIDGGSRERRSHALLYLDLDNFKPVNDTCGHHAGDELLRQLGRLFEDLVRKSDVLARLGGDEFGVFLYDCDVASALKLADQIRHEVEGFRFLWDDATFQVGVSIGLVLVDDRWENIESLFSAADAACYIAKNEGRNRVVVYREGAGNASNRKVATHWVEQIGGALRANRVHLARQPIAALNRRSSGLRYEMLLRLELPDGSIVEPRSFLPSAERYGLSAALDERAFELTLEWLAGDPALQREIRHVSLNLSSATFTRPGRAADMIERIEASGIAPAKLCFEMNETATIANLARATVFMRRLAAIGCRFMIDDFGSGLSSFGWLRKLPVDFLKIDGLLVKDVLDDEVGLTMVRAISEISKSMGKRTVAEHVESPRLLEAMREIGIDLAQGFHVGEPTMIERDCRAES